MYDMDTKCKTFYKIPDSYAPKPACVTENKGPLKDHRDPEWKPGGRDSSESCDLMGRPLEPQNSMEKNS